MERTIVMELPNFIDVRKGFVLPQTDFVNIRK